MIKSYLNNKLFFLIKIFFFYLALTFQCYSENLIEKNRLIVLGQDSATVKVKIFSSFTCPHCANFHFDVVPKIKKEFIDNGKVQIIFIDFPLDQAAFNASKLLHCVDKNRQINFMDVIYEKQNQWTAGSTIEEINESLKKIVKSLGISSTQFDSCLVDGGISDKILSGRIEAHQTYTINSTPTIVINEKKLEGSATFKNIKKRIEKII